MATLNSVLRDIQTLTPNEKRQLKIALEALMNEPSSKVTTIDASNRSEDLFYAEIGSQFKSKYKITISPLATYRHSAQFANFKKCQSKLDTYLEECLEGSKVQRMQRIKFYALYVRLTWKNLESRQIPVSIASLSNSIDQFPGILDRAFPGYLHNNLFLKILENRSG